MFQWLKDKTPSFDWEKCQKKLWYQYHCVNIWSHQTTHILTNQRGGPWKNLFEKQRGKSERGKHELATILEIFSRKLTSREKNKKTKGKNKLVVIWISLKTKIWWWVEIWSILAGIPVAGEPLGHEDVHTFSFNSHLKLKLGEVGDTGHSMNWKASIRPFWTLFRLRPCLSTRQKPNLFQPNRVKINEIEGMLEVSQVQISSLLIWFLLSCDSMRLGWWHFSLWGAQNFPSVSAILQLGFWAVRSSHSGL